MNWPDATTLNGMLNLSAAAAFYRRRLALRAPITSIQCNLDLLVPTTPQEGGCKAAA